MRSYVNYVLTDPPVEARRLKRHLVRSPIGMQIQKQFTLVVANLVQWTAAWVKDILRQVNRNFTVALDQVKTLVGDVHPVGDARKVSHT